MICTTRRHYQPEFRFCVLCKEQLKSRRYLSWRKSIQTLKENIYVTSRGRYCPKHAHITYLSAHAAQLSLPDSTYGLDLLVRIGYQRDYYQMSFAQIRQMLPAHIRVSERHLRNLYRQYLALLACAERLDVEKLKVAAASYGGLILSVDGLEPEGGQPQLWVVREVLTGTLLAAGWLPRVDELTLNAFLLPVKQLDLPWLATVSDKQSTLIKALNKIFNNVPHQYCQAHYLSNAVKPLYDADQHMKTQIRKEVRAKAGATMRQVQAEAKKRSSSNDTPALIVTGLAVDPPTGLEEVKLAARECQARRAASSNGSSLKKASLCQEGQALRAEQKVVENGPPPPPPAQEVVENVLQSEQKESNNGLKTSQQSAELAAQTSQEVASNGTQTPSSQEVACNGLLTSQQSAGSAAQIEQEVAINRPQTKQEVACNGPQMPSSQEVACNGPQTPSSQEVACNGPQTPSSQEVACGPQSARKASSRESLEAVRTIVEGHGVLVQKYEPKKDSNAPRGEQISIVANQQELVDEVVSAYAGRLRRVLSRSGRKPFRFAGLRLYADLLMLLGSLEVSLDHLPNEPRLSCFAEAIRSSLTTYEDEYTRIAEGYSWVLDISQILDVALPTKEASGAKSRLSESVQAAVNAYLEGLCERTDLDKELQSFRKHLIALTKRYKSGLFNCYDIAGLPRTNNDTESLFGRVRRQTVLTSGAHHAKQRLHEQGVWLLFCVASDEQEQLKRLQSVSLEDWRKERKRMNAHQATFTDNRRFRRNPEKYLASLEAQAEAAARASSD